jgi:hypothetical protein
MFADDAVARIFDACAKEPIDWSTITGASLGLDAIANTKPQKDAVLTLKRASSKTQVQLAVSAIKRSFLDGKPDVDGWPRRF